MSQSINPDALPSTVSLPFLIERYPNLFIDAYGVLLEERGAKDGAVSFIQTLNQNQHEYFIVTNGAATDPQGHSERYARFGVQVPPERIISSGYLLIQHLEQNHLKSLPTFATGPASAITFLKRLGLSLVDEKHIADARQFLIMEEPEGHFLELAELVMNNISDIYERGESCSLILPNPDIIYPSTSNFFRFTAGSFALLVEHGLALRFGEGKLCFDRLGKPSPQILNAAKSKCANPNAPILMIGDQLQTDIAGANHFGIDSALVLGGVVSTKHLQHSAFRPTYLLKNLQL